MNVNNDLENPLLTENGNKTLTGKRVSKTKQNDLQNAELGTGGQGIIDPKSRKTNVSFVENNSEALAILHANIAKLRFQSSTTVLAVDAVSLSHWRGKPAQLVFADAPYQSGDGLIAVNTLANIGALADGAIIVVETGKAEMLSIGNGSKSRYTIIEARSYGKAMLHFLTYRD